MDGLLGVVYLMSYPSSNCIMWLRPYLSYLEAGYNYDAILKLQAYDVNLPWPCRLIK